jgi:hypothetical protein
MTENLVHTCQLVEQFEGIHTYTHHTHMHAHRGAQTRTHRHTHTGARARTHTDTHTGARAHAHTQAHTQLAR